MTADQIFPWVLLIALIINGVASLVVNFKISKTKDATIESKQAEIDSLKQFTSSHVFAEYQGMKTVLEDSIDRHKEELAEKDKQIAEANLKHQAVESNTLDIQRQRVIRMLDLSRTLHNNMMLRRVGLQILADSKIVFPGPPSDFPKTVPTSQSPKPDTEE